MSVKRLSKLDGPKNISSQCKILSPDDFIVSKTDTKGFITYCNRIFVEMSGYDSKDLIGANHNLIRHPDMPRLAYKLAWSLISAKKEFFGFVKNLRADGGCYWVYTYITADLDKNGQIIGYTSFRRRPNEKAIETIIPLYKKLVQAEQSGGMEASGAILESVLKENKKSYDELIIGLQQGGA